MDQPGWSFPPSTAFLTHVVEVRKKGDWVPCPKCGARDTQFHSLARLPIFEGYKCSSCGFAWSWADVKSVAAAHGWIECPACHRRNPAARQKCWSCDALLHEPRPEPSTVQQEGPLSQKLRAARDPHE